MSNYRTAYTTRGATYRPLTAKQRRRLVKKEHRDLVYGTAASSNGGEVSMHPGNLTKPAPLSGHPGRRRGQLAERAAIAEERAILAAMRKQAAAQRRAGIIRQFIGGRRRMFDGGRTA